MLSLYLARLVIGGHWWIGQPLLAGKAIASYFTNFNIIIALKELPQT